MPGARVIYMAPTTCRAGRPLGVRGLYRVGSARAGFLDGQIVRLCEVPVRQPAGDLQIMVEFNGQVPVYAETPHPENWCVSWSLLG